MSARKDNRLTASARGIIPAKVKRANRPPEGEAFIWHTAEFLSSPAVRSLTAAARLTLDRLMIEHMAHGGTKNGNLICTHKDIAAHGVREATVPGAIAHLDFMGLIRVRKGRFFRGEHMPNRFRLTWLPVTVGQSFFPASNEWKSITDQHVKAFKRQKTDEAKTKRLNAAARKQRKAVTSSNVLPLRSHNGADV